ncbi:hypothetical protein BKA93DRAFT_822816 [Sparassis latifolia]
MDASVILRKYTLTEALLHIEIFTELFDLILWKAWAVQMHVLLVFMVQAQSEAASMGIILPLSRDIPVLAQVEIHLATARTIEGGRRMIPRIADHLPAVIPHGLTARVLYDDPTVREDFGLDHPPDGLPDIEYDLHDAVVQVQGHLARGDRSAQNEVQQVWIYALSDLVGVLEAHFKTLTNFRESDFDPREVDTIRTAFVDVIVHACAQSFPNALLPEPSQDEIDAAMERLALGHDYFTEVECRAALPPSIHVPACDACQIPKMSGVEVQVHLCETEGKIPKCIRVDISLITLSLIPPPLATSTHTAGSPGPQMKRSRGKTATALEARRVAESSSMADAGPVRGRIPYVNVPPMPRPHHDALIRESQKGLMQDLEARITNLEEEQERLKWDKNKATTLLNKLRGAPTPAADPDDLAICLNGFDTALYYIHQKQDQMAPDFATMANALCRAGVTILTLHVEQPDSDADNEVPAGLEENDDDEEV